MSDPKRRAPAARAAAALALFAVAAAVPQANAAVTRAPFQQMATLSCAGGHCRADFIDLPDNKALEIEKVWCEVLTTGTVWRGEILYLPATPTFIVPLDLLWQRTVGTTKVSTLGAEPSMRVPLGRKFIATIAYGSGTAAGNCTFTGRILIQS